jgi:hypothetical protein
MPFDVKCAMAASEATLELGSSYGALPIFTTQSSPVEALETVLVHPDSAIDDTSDFGTVDNNVVVLIEEADCKRPELNFDNPGSDLDRFKPGCSAAL